MRSKTQNTKTSDVRRTTYDVRRKKETKKQERGARRLLKPEVSTIGEDSVVPLTCMLAYVLAC